MSHYLEIPIVPGVKRTALRHGLLLLLALLGWGTTSGSALAAGTALDCSYTSGLYIYAPAMTVRAKPNLPVWESLGGWNNISSPGDWRCRVLPAYQNNVVRGGVEVFSPYTIAGMVNVDGVTYNVFNSVVKAGLGYIVRFRVTGAGFSSDWLPMNGYSAAQAVMSTPLLGPLPYNNGAYFTLNYEMQIQFIKTATTLSDGTASAFDPVYIYTYRTWNDGANSQRETGAYRIVQFSRNLNVQVMKQTCNTPSVLVELPTVTVNNLTGIGTVRGLKSFDLNFNNCPSGLVGISYKFGATTPVLDAANGVVRLDSTSTAKGVGVLLRHANNDPIKMNTEYVMSGYNPGSMRSYTVPLKAGIYQTEERVKSGSVRGGFTFTMIYR